MREAIERVIAELEELRSVATGYLNNPNLSDVARDRASNVEFAYEVAIDKLKAVLADD